MTATEMIKSGRTRLGIEFGSTRIKAVLTGEDNRPLAQGSHTWENRLENGVWTYSEEDIIAGLRGCYRDLARDISERYGVTLRTTAAIGISGMMHGYLPLSSDGGIIAPFRTWRNTITEKQSEELTQLLSFPIPQRWSVSHLLLSIENREEHLPRLSRLTTLAGYIHFRLTGSFVLGVGEASGMFPIDDSHRDYDPAAAERFDDLSHRLGFDKNIRDILPKVLYAGECGGTLTAEGAALLDESGMLESGIPLCPPEGDAGTGMAATNSVSPRTGNVSAGTSIFAMVVLEKPLSAVHHEIDIVATPDGRPVAMVHCNNCTSDINAWVSLIAEAASAMGADTDNIYELLFKKAMDGAPDGGGLVGVGYLSGEHVTGFSSGMPLFLRKPDADMSLGSFMRTLLYSSVATLSMGLSVLRSEDVAIDRLFGHGGFFKTQGVGDRILAAAANTPVLITESAGEGGAWGAALLASYMADKDGLTLPQFLEKKVFSECRYTKAVPSERDILGFAGFMDSYRAALTVERAAVDSFGRG